MAFAHSFPIDGTKPQDDDAISNEYPGPSIDSGQGGSPNDERDVPTQYGPPDGRARGACGARRATFSLVRTSGGGGALLGNQTAAAGVVAALRFEKIGTALRRPAHCFAIH